MKLPAKPKSSASGAKPIIFLKEVQAELAKVDWPTRQQTMKLTGIVVGVSAITAMFLGGFDFLFTKLMAFLVK